MEESLNIKECIGCGFCCTKALCGAALRLYSTNTPPCPALKWEGDRHICALMVLPGIVGESYRKELYAGEGCCMNLNTWRIEPLQDRTKKEKKPEHIIPPLMQKFLKCLGAQFISSDRMFLALSQLRAELLKDGESEAYADTVVLQCVYKFKNSKSSFTDDFMG